MRAKLTNTAVEKFTCRDGREQDVLWDGEVKGFGMRYSARSETRTYFLQYRVKGSKQERAISIGRHNDPWRVDQARAEALKLKAQMVAGVDPVAEEQKRIAAQRELAKVDAAQTATLREVMAHYLAHKQTKHGPLRPATQRSLRETIERYLSAWLDLPMASTVTREACLVRFIELSETEANRAGGKGKKAAANMTFTYLRALCNHARDLYEQEDGTPRIFVVNPVTRMIKVRKFNPEKARKGRIPRDRVGGVYSMLRKRSVEARTEIDRTAADWVSTVLLTGMRLTESASLKRTQVNLERKTLHLLGDVVKNHNELVLPLSTELHHILNTRLTAQDEDTPAARRRRRERASEYVFPSFGRKTPYVSDARATLDAVSAVAGCHISMHDLRRTYEDVLRYAKVDPDVRRVLLNHLADGVHQESYANDDSDDALRPSVEAAAQWIIEQAKIAESDNVIQFPAKTG